jgi:hypothetical protein
MMTEVSFECRGISSRGAVKQTGPEERSEFCDGQRHTGLAERGVTVAQCNQEELVTLAAN